LLSSQKIDQVEGTVMLKADELRRLWQDAKRRYPDGDSLGTPR